MGFHVFVSQDSVDADYDKAARVFYPGLLKTSAHAQRIQHAVSFADALGNPGEFAQYVNGKNGDRETKLQHLLECFQHNIRLLVEKTWVEKNDEKRKERLLSSLDKFLGEYRKDEYIKALPSFASIANELGFLLFGEQSLKPDFLEYCVRIDPKLGLFWWFVEQLKGSAPTAMDNELVKTQLLLGIYFLASY